MSEMKTLTVNGIRYDIRDANAVPKTRTVNGKTLDADVVLSAADVNAAPRGYATETGYYTNYADALARIKSVFASMGDGEKRCLYVAISNGSPWNGEFPSSAYLVEIYREGADWGVVEFTNNAYIKIVVRISGSWGDFCYENPPMVLGVEYRTTERWDGNPVYTKMVSCGTMPNTSTSNINALSSTMNIIDYDAVVISSDIVSTLPVLDTSGNNRCRVRCLPNDSVIQVTAYDDMSDFTLYVTLRYTKD